MYISYQSTTNNIFSHALWVGLWWAKITQEDSVGPTGWVLYDFLFDSDSRFDSDCCRKHTTTLTIPYNCINDDEDACKYLTNYIEKQILIMLPDVTSQQF